MKVGILGSGDVAKALGNGFLQHGHDVMPGTRDPAKLADWTKQVRFLVALIFISLAVGGCAFGHYARGPLSKTTQPFPVGTGKEVVLQELGLPDKQITIGEIEYLTYKTKKGWFFLLFGITKARDCEIRLIDGKVASVRWMPAGSSFGIVTPQGAVAQ